ncbi:MAG TPA: PadR family transcriptional regulator [Candidatus Acidoferrum sp.]|nr:PadR family transcriptional regulator [Candidatus Acidoferrum sp.]
MPKHLNLTYTSGIVLEAVAQGASYGFQIIDETGLPSGTVYPALRRLESAGLIRSVWDSCKAETSGGPARKHYRLTAAGHAHQNKLRERYPLLAKMER